MKRRVFVAGSISTIALASGCAGGRGAPVLRTSSMFGGSTDPGTEVYRSITEAYEAEHEVTIEDSSSPIDEEWRAQIVNDYNAGNAPDVLYFVHGADGQDLVDSSTGVVSVEEIRSSYPDYASNISSESLQAVQMVDAQAYCVPMVGYWMGNFINADLCATHDVEIPTSWDGLMVAIDRLRSAGIVPFALALGHIPHFIIEHMFYAAGGVEALRERPASSAEMPQSWVHGLELLKELYEAGAFPDDTNATTEDAVKEQFLQEQAAMIVTGTWQIGNIPTSPDTPGLLQDGTDIVAFPQHPDATGSEGVVAGWNGGFYLSKDAWNDENKRDLALGLIQAHTSTDAISRYAGPSTGAIAADNSVEPGESADYPLVNTGHDFWAAHRDNYADPACDHMRSDPKNQLYQGLPRVVTGELAVQDLLAQVLDQNAFESQP